MAASCIQTVIFGGCGALIAAKENEINRAVHLDIYEGVDWNEGNILKDITKIACNLIFYFGKICVGFSLVFLFMLSVIVITELNLTAILIVIREIVTPIFIFGLGLMFTSRFIQKAAIV